MHYTTPQYEHPQQHLPQQQDYQPQYQGYSPQHENPQQQEFLPSQFNAQNEYQENCKATFLKHLKDLDIEINDICTETIKDLEICTQKEYLPSEKKAIMDCLKAQVDSTYIQNYISSLSEGDHKHEIDMLLKINSDTIHAKISETVDSSVFLWGALELRRCTGEEYNSKSLIEIAQDMVYITSNDDIEEFFTPELCGMFYDMNIDSMI